DGAGNLVTRKRTSDGGDLTMYEYDEENLLTRVVLPDAGGEVTYKYDGLGRCFEVNDRVAITRRVFDGDFDVQDRDGADAVLATYTHGPRGDELISFTRGATTGYALTDALESVWKV